MCVVFCCVIGICVSCGMFCVLLSVCRSRMMFFLLVCVLCGRCSKKNDIVF